MSRYVISRLVVGEPDNDAATECPDCRFDAVLTFPIYLLSEAGVGTFGTYSACARCYDLAQS